MGGKQKNMLRNIVILKKNKLFITIQNAFLLPLLLNYIFFLRAKLGPIIR